MRKLFGTDGIRGLANQEPMTPETVLKLGQAVGVLFRGRKGRRPRILVGRDPRISGFMLERAFVSGVLSTGATVWEVGVIPTPGVCHLTRHLGADVGAMISASHNPVEDNGIKLFGRAGYKLSGHDETRIERFLADGVMVKRPGGDAIGVAHDVRSKRNSYLDFLNASIPSSLSWPGWKIVVDGANGAASEFIRPLLSMRGAKVVMTACHPNGVNINDHCGAMYPRKLARHVLQERADIGVCFDGDGDRALFCDERGKLLDGDDVLALCADEWVDTDQLHPKVVVGTVMSNFGLEEYLRSRGIACIRTQVGDRNVLKAMKTRKARLGGEPSGHTIFLPRHTTGDGLFTMLQVLAILSLRGRPVSKTARLIRRYPQYHAAICVKERYLRQESPKVQAVVREAQARLGGMGRVVVRPSGTESVMRVMVEAPALVKAKAIAAPIIRTIQALASR